MQLRSPLRAVALLVLLGVGACHALTGPSTHVVLLEVAPAMVRCNDWYGQRDCLQIRSLPGGKWEPLFDQIEGFAFETGFRYVIRVAISKVPNPPADGSDRRYTLLNQLSKRAEPPE